VPDDPENVVKIPSGDVIFLCRNQEAAMKAIQLPSIQQFNGRWIRGAPAWRARQVITSLVREQDGATKAL